MKKITLILILLIFISGCTTVNVVEKKIVFPHFSSVFASLDLVKLKIKAVIIKPVRVEDFPGKKETKHYTEILVNLFNKMGIKGVVADSAADVDELRKKYKTSYICSTSLLYKYIPSSAAAAHSSSGDAFASGNLNLRTARTSSSGMYSEKGHYYQFSGATLKIKDVKKDKVVFSDDVVQQPNEYDAINRIMSHFAMFKAGNDVDEFEAMFYQQLKKYKEKIGESK